MEGSPNGLAPLAFHDMVHQPMRTSGRFLLAGVVLSLGVLAAPATTKEWNSTIGQPLRDSTEQAIQLVDHLRSIGARFYGSWTCPACFRQMNLFGKQAGTSVPYIECRKPKQLPDQAAACDAAQIRAYPTWVLPDGRRREGLQTLEALSSWTGLN